MLETVRVGNPSREVGRDGVQTCEGFARLKAPTHARANDAIPLQYSLSYTSTVHDCAIIPSQINRPKPAYDGTLPFRIFGKD